MRKQTLHNLWNEIVSICDGDFHIWILNIKYLLQLTCWRLSSLVWNERCWRFASSLWGLGTFSLNFVCRPSSRTSSTSPDLLRSRPRCPSWALGLANLNQREKDLLTWSHCMIQTSTPRASAAHERVSNHGSSYQLLHIRSTFHLSWNICVTEWRPDRDLNLLGTRDGYGIVHSTVLKKTDKPRIGNKQHFVVKNDFFLLSMLNTVELTNSSVETKTDRTTHRQTDQ